MEPVGKGQGTWKPVSGQGGRELLRFREPGNKPVSQCGGQGDMKPVRFREAGNQPVSQCGARET